MGFFTKQYCSDCVYMTENEVGKGKFKCESECPYDEVYADKYAGDCRVFCDAFRRSSATKERLFSISYRSHFIITSICDILNLNNSEEYHNAFLYMRETYLPLTEEGIIFMEDYEDLGPICATKLHEEEENNNYVEYLRSSYLDNFLSLIKRSNTEAAFEVYQQMYSNIKNRYDLKRDIQKKVLVNPDCKKSE